MLYREIKKLIMSMLAANSLRGWWTPVYFTLLDSRSIQSAASVVRDERQAKLNKIELPCVRPSPGEGVSHPPLLTSVYLLVGRLCPGVGSDEHALTVVAISFSNAISISKRIKYTRSAKLTVTFEETRAWLFITSWERYRFE